MLGALGALGQRTVSTAPSGGCLKHSQGGPTGLAGWGANLPGNHFLQPCAFLNFTFRHTPFASFENLGT